MGLRQQKKKTNQSRKTARSLIRVLHARNWNVKCWFKSEYFRHARITADINFARSARGRDVITWRRAGREFKPRTNFIQTGRRSDVRGPCIDGWKKRNSSTLERFYKNSPQTLRMDDIEFGRSIHFGANTGLQRQICYARYIHCIRYGRSVDE